MDPPMAVDPAKKVVLRCNDGKEFETELALAMESLTIKNLVEDGCVSDGVVPLLNVDGPTLSKIIGYWKEHASSEDEEKLRQFDEELLKMDRHELFELIMAANYLDCKKLLDLTCQRCADLIKNMMPEEVREFFGIENDFTPEEEESIKQEYPWAFD